MRTRDNLHQHEIIGLRLRVVRAQDGSMVGMEGTVVDETRQTLRIERDGSARPVTVPKRGAVFEARLPDGTSTVLEGDGLAFRPEDRTKRATRRPGDGNRDERGND